MGPVAGIPILALALAIVGAVTAALRWRMRSPTAESLGMARDSEHETIDEIELARVRSMLSRR